MKVIGRSRPVEVDADLVGADVLGDAAGLGLADVGLADGVQQSGLAVVDVTHHGHHRRTGLQVVLAALVLAVGEVEGFQQLAVLVLGGHDLNVVVHLAAQQLQRLVADRLGGGDHLAEVEQRLHQGGGVGVDLLGEVGQRSPAGQPDGLAVAVRQPHAADDRRLHRVVFLTLLPLRLAPASWCATRAPEGARGSAALTGTATTAATAAGTAAIAAAAPRVHRYRRLRRRRGSCHHRRRRRRGVRRDRRRVRDHREPAGARRDAPDVLAHRRHPGRGGMLPGEAPGRGPPPGAGHPGGVPAAAGSAGRPAGPRRTGCCRRAGSGRRASGAADGAGPGRGTGCRTGAGRRAAQPQAGGAAGAAGGSGGAAGLGAGAFCGRRGLGR